MNLFIYLVICIVVAVFPSVSDQNGVCDNEFLSYNGMFRRDPMNMRTKDDMMQIALGKRRMTKCKFLRKVLKEIGQSGSDCGIWINAACPARRRRNILEVATSGAQDTHSCCTEKKKIKCNKKSRYRNIDGSCNNLINRDWGQAGSHQIRYLGYNAYDDGKGTMKTKGCGGSGTLPNPRTISTNIHSAGPTMKFESYFSYLVMQFGQFLIHDAALTEHEANEDGNPLMCCGEDQANSNCKPISIPHGDAHFVPDSCMEFIRSKFEVDCSYVRKIINSQTSWFDASTVYGSSKAEAKNLRSLVDGKLKNVDTKLPVDIEESTCILVKPFDAKKHYCGFAGDIRVHEQPGLASMHTVFLREHNRIAAGLKAVNPHWNDERLYQEARRILIAEWQHVIYNEFLPVVLGKEVIALHGLEVPAHGYNDNYNKTIDGTVSLPFTTAVFRHGHSQANTIVGRANAVDKQMMDTSILEDEFFKVSMYHGNDTIGMDNIIHWTTSTNCPFTDRKVQDSVRQNLFKDDLDKSFDLVSLNIQRSRDHGLPGYTAYYKYCDLGTISSFQDLKDHDSNAITLLQQTYDCVDDIDLFTGMMSEKRLPGSLLGRTWVCLMALEFKRLRDGDRFFYERYDPRVRFTLEQLNSIKQVTTSTIICQNTDAQTMQPNAYMIPNIDHEGNITNSLLPCSDFVGIDFTLWKESPTKNEPNGKRRRRRRNQDIRKWCKNQKMKRERAGGSY